MPFRRHAPIEIENSRPTHQGSLPTRVTYEALAPISERQRSLHARWRRSNPLPYQEVSIILLDGVVGQGHYVGTYPAWGVNNSGWWGEGENQVLPHGDVEWPTHLWHLGPRTDSVGRGTSNIRKVSTGSTRRHFFSACRGHQTGSDSIARSSESG